MRAAISHLVSSMVFSLLASNCEAFFNISRLLNTSIGSRLMADNSKPSPNEPEQPAPHRGSGRKELFELFSNIYSIA
ncbi:MAG: hypothetical protein F6K61_09905 [Sphaerospermopsis sp. SIO1G1]|nr:hypothetical protein [Sphaerospermopsis sp. SIO1G1]